MAVTINCARRGIINHILPFFKLKTEKREDIQLLNVLNASVINGD